MPDYTYKCRSGHTWQRIERMLYSTAIVCSDCKSEAWRVPQVPRVNWNGPKPSTGEIGPSIKALIDNEDENRDKLAAMKADHVKRTAQEAQHASSD